MSTHNICFYGEIRKIISELSPYSLTIPLIMFLIAPSLEDCALSMWHFLGILTYSFVQACGVSM